MDENIDGKGISGDDGDRAVRPVRQEGRKAAEVPAQSGKRRVKVANSWGQSFEFCIRGRWIRWEPKGKPGSIVEISEDEAADAEFRRLASIYFNVKEATK